MSSGVCAGVVHVFSGCDGVGLLGGIWLAAVMVVPGDLSWWVGSQKNIDSILVAWLDLRWFSLFLFLSIFVI